MHIVDLYHAREHLAGLGKLVYGTETPVANGWIADRYDELDDGAIDAVVHAFRQIPSRRPAARDQVRKEIEYFETNSLGMCYHAFRPWACSSAPERSRPVARPCRPAPELSGMRWTVAGAKEVIALRCNLLSNGGRNSGASGLPAKAHLQICRTPRGLLASHEGPSCGRRTSRAGAERAAWGGSVC